MTAPRRVSLVPPVLRIRAFRRLWTALTLSSLGDWLGLLATTSLAQELFSGYSGKLYALSGVLIVRLAPALVIGPVAGAFADRFDRRTTMVVSDLGRFAFFASLPFLHSLLYLLVASFLIECFSLFWVPAKEASVPNLVPKEQLESANQLSLVTTYGSAAVAAVVFALLAKISLFVHGSAPANDSTQTDIALYFDAATFLFSAGTIFTLREIRGAVVSTGTGESEGLGRSIVGGWRFIATSRWLRGLLFGILGATAAGGTVIGLGRPFAVLDLGGGNAAYGVLFAMLFAGLATGMLVGPRLLSGFSRRRLMALAIVAAGVSLAINALMPNLALAIVFTFLVGAFAGVTWVTGITLVGLHVSDEMRGRTFSSLYTLMRIDLLLVIAAAPLIAGAIGSHHVQVSDDIRLRADGVTVVLFVAGLLGAVVGAIALRLMDDRPGVPLRDDLIASLRRVAPPHQAGSGCFVAFEGGEGAGKTTQIERLADWLRSRGRYEVVVTREPGGTATGRRLRELLLDPASTVSPQAEALLYAADRAQHVAEVVGPALARGAVVISDRYVDSSLAYQGAGRALAPAQVERLSSVATGGLVPDLTVLLDVDPVLGLARADGTPDRLEGESLEFHQRVRSGFLALAAKEPRRYLVVDAALPAEEVQRRVRARLEQVLSVRADAAAAAGSSVGSWR
jgi:dTMP kinase